MVTPEQKRLLALEATVIKLTDSQKLALKVIEGNVHKINELCILVENLNKRVVGE